MISKAKSKKSMGKPANLKLFFINLTNCFKSARQLALLVVFCGVSQLGLTEETGEASVSPMGASPPPVSSKVARSELQNLMDAGMKLLVSELVEEGTFFPFVAMLGHDGEVRLIGTPAALRNKQANASEALDALVAKAKQLAKENRIRAAAFFMDYVATRADAGFSQPGIRVELSHIHPDALSVFIPYTITADAKLRVMTPQYKPGKNIVFAPRSSAKSP